MQAILTVIVLNLKYMVKLLYVVGFRNPSPTLAQGEGRLVAEKCKYAIKKG